MLVFNEKKLRKSFAKIKYDIYALDKKIDVKYEDLKKSVDNLEKLLNSRIDMVLELINKKYKIKTKTKRK
ncbi:MAG: hypothetical protein QXD62_03555 [Candidatus Woesearchaeota archaeon]